MTQKDSNSFIFLSVPLAHKCLMGLCKALLLGAVHGASMD